MRKPGCNCGLHVGTLLELFSKLTKLRGMALKFCHHGWNRPDEHAGIPGKITTGKKLFGLSGIRLFTKARDLVGVMSQLLPVQNCGLSSFYVSVGWAGPGRLDPNRDEASTLGGCRDGVFHDRLKCGGIQDQLVGRQDHHGRFWITGGDQPDAESNSGRCVPPCGFCEDIFRG